MLSYALEEIFRLCKETDKPLVMEDLNLKHTADRYSSKKRNYKTSRFAFRKITNLTESKSFKKGIIVKKIDPAYTSQQGKILFQKKYGMSIHEAASAVIARRGMGIREKLPMKYYDQLKPYQRMEPRITQWEISYRKIKGIHASDMYIHSFID